MGAPYKLYGGPYATVPYDSVQYIVRINVCKNVVCTEKHREIVAFARVFLWPRGAIFFMIIRGHEKCTVFTILIG